MRKLGRHPLKLSVVLILAMGCVLPVARNCLRASSDDPVTTKMLALFGRFDADHDGVLSPDEQKVAITSVGKEFGDQWARQIEKMMAHAASADGTVSQASWEKQVANYGRKPAATTVMAEMRDGKKLATDISMPRGDGPFPVILSRTPYGRRKGARTGAGYAAGGVVYIMQDMRGRFDSEGENLPFIGCGCGEHLDGVDTLNWILKQKWCDGHIATIGGSAGGITQNLLAGAAPKGLAAQYISVAASDFYANGCYIGGAFRKADDENWLASNKFDPRAGCIVRSHPNRDAYWANYDTTQKFADMNVPAVHIGGWFDMFCQGTLDEFVGRQHQGASGSRGTQKLVMGPWTHGIGKMPAGEMTFPNASRVPREYDSSRWFDRYLRGIDNGVDKEPAVAYYVMGDFQTPGAPGNEWRHADDWPIPAQPTPYYFTRDHRLTADKPSSSADAIVEYTFDPAHPCPTIGGNNLTIARGPMKQNAVESRGDVVLFTTAPLESPIEVTGRVKAHLYVSSSAPDTDLSIRLCDVYPDGSSYLIAEGILRMRFRDSFGKPRLMTPGKIEQVTVDCWSTSLIFNQGHRIRATATSSNYPRFDVNPGTGQPWSDAGAKVTQTNRIYCDGEHASYLELPIAAGKK